MYFYCYVDYISLMFASLSVIHSHVIELFSVPLIVVCLALSKTLLRMNIEGGHVGLQEDIDCRCETC